jgi:NAD(P)-dependent dehydrogenase (short-subunit alcohol dehydrogenase family)
MGQPHSGPMAGRTVLVTGVSGGIGWAAALGPARMEPGDLRPGPREHRGRSRVDPRRISNSADRSATVSKVIFTGSPVTFVAVGV